MEKTMEHVVETALIKGFKQFNSSCYIGETILVTIYTHYGGLV